MVIILRPQVVRKNVKEPWKPVEWTEKKDEVTRPLLVNNRKLLAAAKNRLEAEFGGV